MKARHRRDPQHGHDGHELSDVLLRTLSAWGGWRFLPSHAQVHRTLVVSNLLLGAFIAFSYSVGSESPDAIRDTAVNDLRGEGPVIYEPPSAYQEVEDAEEFTHEHTDPITWRLLNDSDFTPVDDNNTKLILFWTKVYRGDASKQVTVKRFSECKYTNCRLTINKDLYNRSHAVMFHMWNLRYMSSAAFPRYRYPLQRWVAYGRESPMSTNITDRYNGVFNHTHTYRLDGDTQMKYGCTDALQGEYTRPPRRDYAKGKDSIACWLVSHCNATSLRDQYVEMVQEHVQVDIYGRCGPFECFRKSATDAVDRCFTMLGQRYKFFFALENSLCKDYVTEKAFEPMNFDMVPIVMGDVDYSRALPPNSYIDIRDFKSPKELAQYLIKVDRDDRLYNKFFEWKQTYMTTTYCPIVRHYCSLCEHLNTHEEPKVYSDFNQWWNTCSNPDSFFPGVADDLVNYVHPYRPPEQFSNY